MATSTDIPLFDYDSTDGRPDRLHAEGSWGWISWPNRYLPGGREERRGGRITLRHGRTSLAVGEIIAEDRADWDREVRQALARVAPWARVLHILSAVPDHEHRAGLARTYGARVAEYEADEHAQDWLNGAATDEERAAARASSGESALGLPPVTAVTRFALLARSIAARHEREAARCRMIALAAAPAARPDLGPTWVHPDDERSDAWISEHLLAGWRACTAQRDALVSAARENGLTETAISAATGLARTTLTRIATD